MRGNNWLARRPVAKACVIALLLVGCDSARPVGPGSPEPPGEAVQGLRLEARSDTMPIGTVGTTIGHVPVVRLTLNGNPAPGREVLFVVSALPVRQPAQFLTDAICHRRCLLSGPCPADSV